MYFAYRMVSKNTLDSSCRIQMIQKLRRISSVIVKSAVTILVLNTLMEDGFAMSADNRLSGTN